MTTINIHRMEQWIICLEEARDRGETLYWGSFEYCVIGKAADYPPFNVEGFTRDECRDIHVVMKFFGLDGITVDEISVCHQDSYEEAIEHLRDIIRSATANPTPSPTEHSDAPSTEDI